MKTSSGKCVNGKTRITVKVSAVVEMSRTEFESAQDSFMAGTMYTDISPNTNLCQIVYVCALSAVMECDVVAFLPLSHSVFTC